MAKSTVYPISLSLNTLALSCGPVQFSSTRFGSAQLTRSLFLHNAAYFHVSNLGITLIIVHTQLYLHTKCPSAHNICAMLNIRLNFVHFLCSDMLHVYSWSVFSWAFVCCRFVRIRMLARVQIYKKERWILFYTFFSWLLLFQFPSRSLSHRLASPFSGFVYICCQPFLIFHLLSNRINIGILYGSPFFYVSRQLYKFTGFI